MDFSLKVGIRTAGLSLQPVSSKPERFQCAEVSDGYVGSCGHQEEASYGRPQFAQAPPVQLPGVYPSSSIRIGEPGAETSKDWTQRLGEVPKDCYYCKGTGKCYMDSPQLEGGGKDYMGLKCNACSGTGICPRCGGDGILGRPGSTTEATH